MAQLCGVCCGLLAFSAMLLCGLLAGNPVQVIVLRAVGGLFGGLVLGTLAGWVGTLIVQDNIDLPDSADEDQADDKSPTVEV